MGQDSNYTQCCLWTFRIVCQTQWRGQIYSGPVEIRLGKASPVKSADIFNYRVSPRGAPRVRWMCILGQNSGFGYWYGWKGDACWMNGMKAVLLNKRKRELGEQFVKCTLWFRAKELVWPDSSCNFSVSMISRTGSTNCTEWLISVLCVLCLIIIITTIIAVISEMKKDEHTMLNIKKTKIIYQHNIVFPPPLHTHTHRHTQ